MKIAILGACGTFMAGLAVLAKQLGHEVIAYDQNIYPPMSMQLIDAGIRIVSGYAVDTWVASVDQVIVGNAISRGNPLLEKTLASGKPYLSGPEWLRRHVLDTRRVIAVSGTHGKTTTSSMIAWILHYAGLEPSYLIGGQPLQFKCSAQINKGEYFVIEADEYDTAFHDKRSKFLHYKPEVLVINNLEFDHADIFTSLSDIQKQFAQLIRTIPAHGHIIYPDDSTPIREVLKLGCWSNRVKIYGDDTDHAWSVKLLSLSGESFACYAGERHMGQVDWSLYGRHNVHNALVAMAAVKEIGVSTKIAVEALCKFTGVKRRMEYLGCVAGAKLYSDFAHHPTAICEALGALSVQYCNKRLLVLLELGSATQRMQAMLADHQHALTSAHGVFLLNPASDKPASTWQFLHDNLVICEDQAMMAESLMQVLSDEYVVVILSSRSLHKIEDMLEVSAAV